MMASGGHTFKDSFFAAVPQVATDQLCFTPPLHFNIDMPLTENPEATFFFFSERDFEDCCVLL